MERRKRIVCLGDSLTYGYPYGPRYSWVYYAARKTGLNLVNAGVNGDTVEDMARRFPGDVLKREPLAVVILGGTNDAFCSEVTIAQTVYYLEEMIKAAVDNNIQPVIGLPLPVDDPLVSEKLKRICSAYRDTAGRFELAIIDFAPPFIDPKSGTVSDNLYVDGVHPNKAGYEAMGETAAHFFRDHFFQR
ncbi:MAG TPA: GDSL family lipase [Syntrophomonadaceae bacterium]|nr:GDSL family lipase [Syntrophomonadaceae bacterium]